VGCFYSAFCGHNGEACFALEGLFNAHSCQPWARDNPHTTFEHRYQIRFIASVWGGIPEDISLVPISYVTDWIIKIIVVFWNLFYRGCLKMCVYLEGRDYDVGTMELQLTLWKVSDNG
jgi:hypothetical protein